MDDEIRIHITGYLADYTILTEEICEETAIGLDAYLDERGYIIIRKIDK